MEAPIAHGRLPFGFLQSTKHATVAKTGRHVGGISLRARSYLPAESETRNEIAYDLRTFLTVLLSWYVVFVQKCAATERLLPRPVWLSGVEFGFLKHRPCFPRWVTAHQIIFSNTKLELKDIEMPLCYL